MAIAHGLNPPFLGFQVDEEPSGRSRWQFGFPEKLLSDVSSMQDTWEAAESGMECWLLRVSAKPYGETKMRKGWVWILTDLTSWAAGSHCEVKVLGCHSSYSICRRCFKTLGSPSIMGIRL